jgi:hypothetical protein
MAYAKRSWRMPSHRPNGALSRLGRQGDATEGVGGVGRRRGWRRRGGGRRFLRRFLPREQGDVDHVLFRLTAYRADRVVGLGKAEGMGRQSLEGEPAGGQLAQR